MKLEVFLNNLDGLYAQLPDLMQQNMNTAALDGLAIIKTRIIEKGIDHDGQPFPPYSPAYLKKKIAAGRFRGHVDFEFTTDMWSSTGIVESMIEPQQVVVRVGALDEPNKNKMRGIAYGTEKRPGGRGDFMRLSTDEQDDIRGDVADRWKEDVQNLIR